jgi:hypothetical protein
VNVGDSVGCYESDSPDVELVKIRGALDLIDDVLWNGLELLSQQQEQEVTTRLDLAFLVTFLLTFFP